jgi:hypothetical protein
MPNRIAAIKRMRFMVKATHIFPIQSDGIALLTKKTPNKSGPARAELSSKSLSVQILKGGFWIAMRAGVASAERVNLFQHETPELRDVVNP